MNNDGAHYHFLSLKQFVTFVVGTEFHYVNGGLSNVRRGPRDFDPWALADVDESPTNGTSSLMRFAKTFKGRTLLIFGTETNEGDAVWGDADGFDDDKIAKFIDSAEAMKTST